MPQNPQERHQHFLTESELWVVNNPTLSLTSDLYEAATVWDREGSRPCLSQEHAPCVTCLAQHSYEGRVGHGQIEPIIIFLHRWGWFLSQKIGIRKFASC